MMQMTINSVNMMEEAIVFFTILFSVLFLGLSPESVISLCSLSLSSTLPN